jgi:hypothetical protein
MPAISTKNKHRARVSILGVFANKNTCASILSVVRDMLHVTSDQSHVDLDKFTPTLLDRVYKFIQDPDAVPTVPLSTRQKLALDLLSCPPETYQELRALGTTPDHEFDFDNLLPCDLLRLRRGTTCISRFRHLCNKLVHTDSSAQGQILSTLVDQGLCTSLEDLLVLRFISEENLEIFREAMVATTIIGSDSDSSDSEED